MAEQFKQLDMSKSQRPDLNLALSNWLKENGRLDRYHKAKLSVQVTDDTFIAVVKLSDKEESDDESR